MGIIRKAAEYIEKGQVEIIGYNKEQITILVKDKIVVLKRKPGRDLDSCGCENHSRFCKENPRCAHKLAAETYLVMRKVPW
jgi:hypothetical protein